jgi:putative endonuclease
MKFTLYILRTSKNTLYIGQTNNLEKRLKDHKDKKGKGSKYMRAFDSFEVVYTEQFENRSDAMKREISLKKLKRKDKDLLIGSKVNLLQ